MPKYRVAIYWEMEDIEVTAKNKEDAEEKAKMLANMEPNMDRVEVEVLKWENGKLEKSAILTM